MSVLLLCGVLISALKLSGQTRESTVAAQGAQQIFEQLRGGSFLPPAGSVTFDGGAGDAKMAGFPPDPYPAQVLDGRTYTYVVRSQPVSGQSGLHAILVTVNWDSKHKIQMETHVFFP